MVRRLRSPTRTITRKGGKDFQGEFRSPKGTSDPLIFDSMSSLMCAVHLEHRREVVSVTFERERSQYVDVDGSFVDAIHDYHVVLESGEVEHIEAKYSASSLSEKELAKLERLQRAMARDGKELQFVFRDSLEESGYIQTVLLLRRFGQLDFSEASKRAALQRLGTFEATTLDIWQKRAVAAGVITALLFYLLYHQELPLLYERLVATELLPCRG